MMSILIHFSAICELATLFMLNIDITVHPHLHAYIKRMLAVPEIKKVHEHAFGFTTKFTDDLKKEYVELMN